MGGAGANMSATGFTLVAAQNMSPIAHFKISGLTDVALARPKPRACGLECAMTGHAAT